ncbi:tyrosine-type recombinase/integrase [Roseomonas sp. CAU 1739]|uniref:tyrosine-type recombinase/integrase n=1 Tax=Roseomonas sp. CAU 1739 TaxID=3140364 RepID=UPI00325B71C3
MNNSPITAPTIAEALRQLEACEDLPPSRRRTLTSALMVICRIGGKKSPATLRLDPGTCLPMIDGASAIGLGITSKSLQNYRASLRFVLRRLGLLAPVRRREPVSDPAWATLIANLPSRFHPHRLRAFMEYCAAKDVPPGAVTNSSLEDFLRHRTESRGGANTRADVREAARQWNRMRGLVPGWPEIELALGPVEGRVQALPLASYPAGLQAEIEEYLAWLARSPEEAEEDDEVGHEPASPATVETRRKGIRLLLWGLVETGRTPESITRLADLMHFDATKQTLRWHRQRLGKPHPNRPTQTLPTHEVGMLADTVRSLAARYRLSGEADAKLRRMLTVYRPKRQREIGEDLARLLDRLSDPDLQAKLMLLPSLLMRKARRLRTGWTSKQGVDHPPKPREACWMAALAAAIEIELQLPLRVQDLAGLRLGDELLVTDGNGPAAAEVHLRVVANKNGQLVESWLRGRAAETVKEYLQKFRPLGPHPTMSWVFPNRESADRPRAKNHLSDAIADTIHEHTGERMTAHDFRAIAAAIVLEDHPHALEDVRVLLGHAGFEVALRHYRRTNRKGAAQRLSDAIARRCRRAQSTTAPVGLPIDLARWRPRAT